MDDHHGNVVHLGEHECSIQRRFQKIIEESPAPCLTPELHQRICATALESTRKVGYHNAGTVEFILAPDGKFYFLDEHLAA
jgi:acetyl/propionyl-CoA carboxylase alpha subunit